MSRQQQPRCAYTNAPAPQCRGRPRGFRPTQARSTTVSASAQQPTCKLQRRTLPNTSPPQQASGRTGCTAWCSGPHRALPLRLPRYPSRRSPARSTAPATVVALVQPILRRETPQVNASTITHITTIAEVGADTVIATRCCRIRTATTAITDIISNTRCHGWARNPSPPRLMSARVFRTSPRRRPQAPTSAWILHWHPTFSSAFSLSVRISRLLASERSYKLPVSEYTDERQTGAQWHA